MIEFRQHGGGFTSVLRAVIDYMDHGLPKNIFQLITARGSEMKSCIQFLVRQVVYKRVERHFFLKPACMQRIKSWKVCRVDAQCR